MANSPWYRSSSTDSRVSKYVFPSRHSDPRTLVAFHLERTKAYSIMSFFMSSQEPLIALSLNSSLL